MTRLVRVLSLCFVFGALVAGGRCALATPTRPAGAPVGEVIAEVQLRIGAGSIVRAGGHEYPAAPGTALLRDDELVVPAGEVLVVSLRNNYLVRLDDDVSLRVGQIVLVDAPRSTESFVRQLDRLLTREELLRAERIAGVQARMSGADPGGDISANRKARPSDLVEDAAPKTPPAKTAKVASAGQRTSDARQSGAATQGEPETAATTSDRQRASHGAQGPATTPPAVRAAPSPVSAPPPAKPRPPANAPPPPPPPPSTATVHAQPPVAAGPAPAGDPSGSAKSSHERPQVGALPHEAALRKCLAHELRSLPVKLAKVQLRIHGQGGKIDRVGLGGGLLVPSCARKLLINIEWPEAEGRWVDRELALP